MSVCGTHGRIRCLECGGPPVFQRAYPAPMRDVAERDVDLMGETELRVLVKKLLKERNR